MGVFQLSEQQALASAWTRIFHISNNLLWLELYQCVKEENFTGKRRMHKPEEPLPFPLHVRIFVIIPFLLSLAFSLPKHQQPERRRLPEWKLIAKRLLNILAFNQSICCFSSYLTCFSFFLLFCRLLRKMLFITLYARANTIKEGKMT